MSVDIAQDGIELGIVTRDAGPMLEFYRDILGLEFEREVAMSNGVHQTRLKCGPNIIKLIVYTKHPPKVDAPPHLVRAFLWHREEGGPHSPSV